VERRTVQALLTESALQRLSNRDYRFCADPACNVVYFDDEGSGFTTTDLRVPVWQKHAFGDRQVCYCFGVSEASIRAEIDVAGTSRAVDRIRAHIAAGRCACDLRNPRGACCLGDVIAAIARVEAALASETEPADVRIESAR
jgi:hypothetical protein